jgi:acyl-CoA synthetase (AMP-forming)/AMP-acid ligase II
MLKDCRSRMLFVPREFRRFDYAAMAERVKPALPDLAEVVVVRGDKGAFSGFDELLAEEGEVPPPPAQDPNAVKIIMYTSETTGRPKGVLHSNNTLHCEMRAICDYWRVSPTDVIFMPSPVTHATGYMLALEFPWVAGVPAVLLDIWTAARAVELIRDHRCTLTVAATPFLQELLQEAEARGERLPSFRLFACGGASIPPELVRRAFRALENCLAFRVYGSTEAPTITTGIRERGQENLAADTDGEIWNNEVRICDPESGAALPEGAEGEITARGPELFLGFARAEDNAAAFDRDGFFRTGDLGRIEHRSFITVTGRKKDLIIRGGENISPKEIEDALHRHPRIREAAAVSMPHARLGETVCVFMIPADPHAAPALGEVYAWLERAGLARQKFPEYIEIVEDLPRTASGKVKKDILRRIIAEKMEVAGASSAEGRPARG